MGDVCVPLSAGIDLDIGDNSFPLLAALVKTMRS
jgi:hypothetical protein